MNGHTNKSSTMFLYNECGELLVRQIIESRISGFLICGLARRMTCYGFIDMVWWLNYERAVLPSREPLNFTHGHDYIECE